MGSVKSMSHGRVRLVRYCSLKDWRGGLMPAFAILRSSNVVVYVSGRKKSMAVYTAAAMIVTTQ